MVTEVRQKWKTFWSNSILQIWNDCTEWTEVTRNCSRRFSFSFAFGLYNALQKKILLRNTSLNNTIHIFILNSILLCFILLQKVLRTTEPTSLTLRWMTIKSNYCAHKFFDYELKSRQQSSQSDEFRIDKIPELSQTSLWFHWRVYSTRTAGFLCAGSPDFIH